MRGNIHKLNYKKSIRVVYGQDGCYTICDNNVRFYNSLNALKQNIDVDIPYKHYGDNYWGAIKPDNDREYGYIEHNTLYFTNRFGLPSGEFFNCYQVNKFLNLKTFESELKSGELINLGLRLYTEQLPNEQSKIESLYSMVNRANAYLHRNPEFKPYNVKFEIRNYGEFENSEKPENRNLEREVGGQFTPFIRLWVNNGVHTGMMKFHYLLDGMTVKLYRKMNKIGKLKDLMTEYKISSNLDSNKILTLLEYNLKNVNGNNRKIGINDKLKLTDGIVSSYCVEKSINLYTKNQLSEFIEERARELRYQVDTQQYNYFVQNNIREINQTEYSDSNPRSYDVLGDSDFGQIATVKVVDSYACREATVRFITSLDEDYLSAFEELKYDFLNNNIDICIAHYTDLVNPGSYFRKHIDMVYDDSGKRLSGKNKAKQLDVKDKFYNCSLGMPKFMESTHNMSPKSFISASPVSEWNYLNDNIFTVRNVLCECRDFSNRGAGNYPCITVGLNIDEFSVDYGEIVEVYLINKRTGMYKSAVLFTSKSSGTSVSGPMRKKTPITHSVGVTKPVKI